MTLLPGGGWFNQPKSQRPAKQGRSQSRRYHDYFVESRHRIAGGTARIFKLKRTGERIAGVTPKGKALMYVSMTRLTDNEWAELLKLTSPEEWEK